MFSQSGKNLGRLVFDRMHRHSLAVEVQDKTQVVGMRTGTDLGQQCILRPVDTGRHVLHRTMHINDET